MAKRATEILATLNGLERDEPGILLMVASTGIDLRNRLAYYEEQAQAIPDV